MFVSVCNKINRHSFQLEKRMHRLAKFIIDSRKIILVLFIALACLSVYTSQLTTVENDLLHFLPDETETRRGLKAM